jgi:hypothetical protein
LTVLLMGVAGYALASQGAPEIDASSGMAAVTALTGGLLVLKGRRRKQ